MKYVQDYQAKDENDQPIGKPTHLEAETPEEMFEKLQIAHISATQALARQNRAFNELRARKLTPAPPPVVRPVLTPDQERQFANQVVQPETAKDAIRKLNGTEDLEERIKVIEDERAYVRGQNTANTFMRNHLHDYYSCEANSVAMKDYLKNNNLDWTVDNLEIAFAAIGDSLAKDPKWAVSTNANNTNKEEEEEQIVPPNGHTQNRQASFGIQPGTIGGIRPTGRPSTGKMTKKEVIALSKTNKPEFLRRMRDPRLKAEMDAALASA
jgi:hypothetical protein